MRILIDTHILIWYLDGNVKLADQYRILLNDSKNKVFVSIISLWEIAIKTNTGKLAMTQSLVEIEYNLLNSDFNLLEIKFTHLNTLLNLPLHHKDPFDRLLIAQAISENLTLISADQHFRAYAANLL